MAQAAILGNMESFDSTVVEVNRSNRDEQVSEEQTMKQKSELYSTKKKQSLQARYVYGFVFFMTNILAWVFRDYGQKVFYSFLPKRVCGVDGSNCIHVEGVIRLSLGCFIFFSVMCITTIRVHKLYEARNSWHSGWWPLKFVVYLFSIMISFIIPENIIQIYGEVAHIGAGIFLLLQLISVIHFLTWCNNLWMSDLQPNKCGLLGLFLSTIFYTGSFSGIILMYYLYAPELSCTINIFFITWTAILVIVMMVVSLHSKVNVGLLSSAMMGAYIVFLCWSAIHSEPPIEKCNPKKILTERDEMTTIAMISTNHEIIKYESQSVFNAFDGGVASGHTEKSFFIAIGAIVMATFSTGTDSHAFQFRENEVQSEDDIPYKYDIFHFIFSIGSMYFAMLFMNWELNQPTKKWSMDAGWASTWVKTANGWLAASIYLWKLIYPVLVKDMAVYCEESAQNIHTSV